MEALLSLSNELAGAVAGSARTAAIVCDSVGIRRLRMSIAVAMAAPITPIASKAVHKGPPGTRTAQARTTSAASEIPRVQFAIILVTFRCFLGVTGAKRVSGARTPHQPRYAPRAARH